MAKIRDIQRTAAFAWSPDTTPFIATGTQAGAVSADFSDNTQLELWDLDLAGDHNAELSPVAAVPTSSKFYDIAWGRVTPERPRGIIAGALESGSLDLWSADALLDKASDPLISSTTKHSGAIKALQFNPFKSELLATAGAKGELYVWDLNNVDNPFMLGNKAARADDFDCLDWNKKVPHILVTGGSGGFLTVWDVKAKKESLTLNNLGRKPVSAVAWHPEQQTKLITAIPDDTNPVILLWDLRNSNAPERTLSGHSAGVLSLSWCKQDPDLLLSCGKDNRTIAWNPHTGEQLGEFPVVTNWTFKTSFHPRNPSYSATASFDGKIVVRTLQNTNPAQSDVSATADEDDFFSRASNAQASSFTLKQTPKWLKRPTGATFGFGGKLVSFKADANNKSTVKISTFAADSGVTSATERFEKALQEGNLAAVCEEKTQDARTDEEKAEWTLLRALFEEDTKAKLVDYLGFGPDDLTPEPEPAAPKEEEGEEVKEGAEDEEKKDNRLSSFFGDGGDEGDSFLAELSIQSTQTARTNNPFQIYTGEETEAEKAITKSLVLGKFEKAVDICLKEDRISDAFMLAICGGEKCIEKVKAAYFMRKAKGPNYLRLLASVVGKNPWDIVHNADLTNWKEVFVTLCTYATEAEFGDLCEALGDRLEEDHAANGNKERRQNAAFCYIAGFKLHKLVNIWLAELQEAEAAGLQEESDDSTFSVHARSLQNFIEKVTVFRQAVNFVDEDKNQSSGWKLNALYEKYTEYADVVASQGQLAVAGKYLDLLPAQYPAASVARERIKQATQASAPAPQVRKPQQPAATHGYKQPPVGYAPAQVTPPVQAPYANPAAPRTGYVPPGAPAPPTTAPTSNPYVPAAAAAQTGYKSPYASAAPVAPPAQSGYQYPGYNPGLAGGPSRNFAPTASGPPPSRKVTESWNDTPEITRPPRRTNPAAAQAPIASPFPHATPTPPPAAMPWGGPPPKATPPPPPKGAAPPNRVQSPALRTGSPAAGYPGAPSPTTSTYAPAPGQYAAPPPNAPRPSGKYTPQPGASAAAPPPGGAPPMRTSGAGLPPPPQGTFQGRPAPSAGPQYAPPPQFTSQPPAASNPYAPPPAASHQYAPPPMGGPPMGGPPMGGPPPMAGAPPAAAPPQASAPPSQSSTPAPAPQKHPKGDRTHIPAKDRPIFEILNAAVEKVKERAPPAVAVQVRDTEKRLNILFDHLNNEDLLSQESLERLLELSQALENRDYATAHTLQVSLATNKPSECTKWMPGVKRLIDMSRVME